jgi:hypothetical protein
MKPRAGLIPALLGVSLFALASLAAGAAFGAKRGRAAPHAETPQEAVQKVCAGCHNLELVMDTPKTYEGWRQTIQDMIDRGAKGTPDEYDMILQYLSETMTTVDVNHADADALATVLEAPPDAVAAIVARRRTQPFKDLADLAASVPGLDPAVLQAKKRLILFLR